MGTSSPIWTREEDGAITFSVTSKGITGPEFLERGDFFVGPDAGTILRSSAFEPTRNVTSRIKVFTVSAFSRQQWYPNAVRNYAYSQGLLAPRVEVGCLIAEMLNSNDLVAMDLSYIMTMHRPFIIESPGLSCGFPTVLSVGFDTHSDHHGDWLHGLFLNTNLPLFRSHGLAFEVPG